MDRPLILCHLSEPNQSIVRETEIMRSTAEATHAGSGWGADAKTPQIADLLMVYSTSEYCTSFWCHSAYTCLLGSVLNNAMRLLTGRLRPTATNQLPILAGIQSAELREQGATLSLAYRSLMNSKHLSH